MIQYVVSVMLIFSSTLAWAKIPLSIDPEILEDLLSKAAAYSGYPKLQLQQMPSLWSFSKIELRQEVCPEDPHNCSNMAAFYDTEKNRILIVNSLDMDDDTDNSFLLHELVHAMQHLKNGDDIYKDCPALLETEKEAYAAQNRYLKDRNQFFRAGEGLRFMKCEGA